MCKQRVALQVRLMLLALSGTHSDFIFKSPILHTRTLASLFQCVLKKCWPHARTHPLLICIWLSYRICFSPVNTIIFLLADFRLTLDSLIPERSLWEEHSGEKCSQLTAKNAAIFFNVYHIFIFLKYLYIEMPAVCNYLYFNLNSALSRALCMLRPMWKWYSFGLFL